MCSVHCSLWLSFTLPLWWINTGSANTMNLSGREEVLLFDLAGDLLQSGIYLWWELSWSLHLWRTNPFFFLRRRELTYRQETYWGGRQRLQSSRKAAEGLLLLIKLLFMTVANRVNKVPCVITHMHCSVMSKLFKENNPHKLCPVFKETMVLVFKNIERDLPLSIK